MPNPPRFEAGRPSGTGAVGGGEETVNRPWANVTCIYGGACY